MADIESIVKQIVAKLTGNSSLIDEFKKDPVATITNKLGISVPSEQIQDVIKKVMAQIGVKNASSFIEKIKAFFKK